MSASTAGPLPITAELGRYYSALVAAQPAVANIRIASHPTTGRHLVFSPPAASPSTSSPLPAFTALFTEAAAVFASDDPAVCIACHHRHRASATSQPSSCSERGRYRVMKAAINGIGRLADDLGYGETRGLLVVDWLMRVMQDRERRRQRREQRTREEGSAASLAASFALPPPPPQSFSFAIATQGKKTAAAAAPPSVTASVSSSLSSQAEEPLCPSSSSSPDSPSLPSLAMSAVFSLDPGPASLSSSHSRLACAIAQLLPLHVRRLVSVSELRRLLGILELNAHELVDEAGEKGEALFPFFALIEHSCRENCAFTALAASASSSSPAVRVCSIRAIAASSPLTICYAPPYLPTTDRLRYLQSRYHFTCSCPLCSGHLPDRCRAFVCRDSQCRSPVWVWGEGSEEQGVRHWRCSSERCQRAIGEEDVRLWREAEKSLGAEVERLLAQAEEESETEEKGDSVDSSADPRGRREQQQQDLERLSAIIRLICSSEQQTELDGLEDETDEESEEKAKDEREGAEQEAKETKETTAAAAVSDASVSVSSSPLSKSQQKNRKRREKQKRAAQAAAAARHGLQPQLLSLLHPSHHLAHWLLQHLIARHSALQHWAKAAHCSRQRVRNVRLAVCSGGAELHWQEALEWSQLASLYARMGDGQRLQQRQRRCLQHCFDINRRCFGDDAASTVYAAQQLAAVSSSSSSASDDKQTAVSRQHSKRETERAARMQAA